MLDESYAVTAAKLWNVINPNDCAQTVSFYKVDKGWWRLSPQPGRFYDFFAKRVGEGGKSNTDAGIASSKAVVVIGLELIDSWEAAFAACSAHVVCMYVT